MKHVTLANGLSVLLYLAVMGSALWGLHRAHDWALSSYGPTGVDAPQRQKEWDEWRETAKQQAAGNGPVQRRVPKSGEPPTLVLLRDYYGMCIAALLLFGSVLFGTFVFLIRGMVTSPGRIRGDARD